MLGLTFSSKLDWGIISIAKTASKKIRALIRSMKFLSLEVAISINLLYGHACNTFVMSGLVLLIVTWNSWKSYKNEYVGLLVLHLLPLETLAHRQNVASLSLFYRYHFGRCSFELVPLPYSRGRSTRYSDRLQDFSATVSRCYKHAYVNNFFPRIGRLWNFLPIECFLLTYDLNNFKSRINRYLLTVSFF